MSERERQTSRNELLFGAAGQAHISAIRGAVVGLGGLGSHVVQQLAYLGTERFVLVDHDRVTESSLNRLVGAGPDDAAGEVPKVVVAERLVRTIRPKADVQPIDAWIDDPEAATLVQSCDVVFGCVDADPPRLALTELTSRHRLPYFDLATDVDGGASQYGGRMLLSIDGERCLSCMGMLNQDQLRQATRTPEQAAEDQRIYGIQQRALGAAGPSVIPLNGVVASLGVMEFMVWATRMRDPRRYLVYHGERGIVTANLNRPADHCPYCRR